MSEEEKGGFQTHGAVPGDLLLSRPALGSMLLLGLNDHCLKATYHNWITGKLSDFAGLVVFPCVLVSAWEWARFFAHGIRREDRGREVSAEPEGAPADEPPFWRASRGNVAFACFSTASAFVAIKVSPVASDFYCALLGSARAVMGGPPLAQNVVDPSDLLALPAVFVPLFLRVARSLRGRKPFTGQERRPLLAFTRGLPRHPLARRSSRPPRSSAVDLGPAER